VLLSNTTQAIPARVNMIPNIFPLLRVSSKKIQARIDARAGDKLRNKRPNLGPRETYAWKRNKSPMAKPTMPDVPNQNQRSAPAVNGTGFPKTTQ
jgi:hypothetical protein